MKKHIVNKDIDDECLYVEFERYDNVDVCKHDVRIRDDDCKESWFLVERTRLIDRSLRWMLCIVMMSIIIGSKESRPCHVRSLWFSFVKFCWVVFEMLIYTELTSNRDHSWGSWVLFHDFEIVYRCMWGYKCCLCVFFGHSFAHCATNGRGFVDVRVGWVWNLLGKIEILIR